MTSKEALKNICLECEKEKGKNKTACPFRSISNDYCEEYEKIKKDLEVLAILKEYLYYNNENHFIKMKPIRKSVFNYNYEDLKEWLEHGKRKIDRNLQ